MWFRNQNRLGRNMNTHIAFLNVCIKSETKIFFESKEFDYLDPTEDLIGNVLSALNSYTTKLQSKQTKKALLDNIKQGKAHSVIAYGYATNEERYLIVEESEAEVVKRMYLDHASGKGCGKIAEELNDEGVPTRYSKLKNPTSGKWHDKTVRDILRNSIYYGRRNWGGKTYPAPAIVTKELFDQSIKAFETNQNTRGKKVDHKYILNGILKCGVCGRNMNGRRRVSGKDNAYTCSGKRKKGQEKCHNRSINIDAMEEFIWNRFFVEERFIELVSEAVEATRDNGKERQLESDLEKIDELKDLLYKEKRNAARLAIKGLIDDDTLEAENKLSDIKIKDLLIKKEKIDADLSFIKTAETQHNTIKSEINSLKVKTPFNLKRDIINKYVKFIAVSSVQYEHVIWMCFHIPVKDETYLRYKRKFYSLNDLPDGVNEIVDLGGINYFKG